VWTILNALGAAAAPTVTIRNRETVRVKGSGRVMDLSVKVAYKPIAAPVGALQPLVLDQLVEAGQQLIANETGEALLAFEDTEIRMERGSTLVLAKATNGLVAQIQTGAVYVLTRGEQALAFATPHGEIVGLGSEYEIRVLGDHTTVTIMEGAAAISSIGLTNRLRLEPNEQGTLRPGQAPQKQPIRAENVMQWWLYYPGVIDTDELPLNPLERAALSAPLQAYRDGDFLEAYRQMPPRGADNSAGQRLFRVAVLLGLGDIIQARQQLSELGGSNLPLATAMRTLIAAVAHEIEQEPPSAATASEWVALSYWHQARHELGRALEAARKATEQSPEFGFAWARVAELEFGHGRTRASERAIQRSVALSPRHAPTQALRGFVSAAQNRIEEAIGAFNAALDLDHRLGDAWLGLGLCRIRRGELEAGREDLKAAVLVEPNRALLRSYLGKAFGESKEWLGADRQLELATNELAMAMRLDPNDPTPWLYRALLEREQNHINPAVTDLEKSIEHNDNRALYRSRQLLDEDKAVRSSSLANLYQSAGMEQVAVQEAAKAVSYDYANYSSHLFLSESYNALRDPTRFNLRYETLWFSEWLLASLLSPVGGTPLSQHVSQQEYVRLFEHDRVGLSTDSSYRSDGQYRELASQFGNLGKLSWSLDLDYQHNNGVRPNNELDRIEWYTTIKYDLTPQDSMLLLTKYQDYHSGDNFQYYYATNARPAYQWEEVQAPIAFLGYHRAWSPGVHTLALAGHLDNDQDFSDKQAQATIVFRTPPIDPPGPRNLVASGGFDVDHRSTLDAWSMELQQLFDAERHTTILGTRWQTGDIVTHSRLTNPSNYTGNATNYATPPADDTVEADLDRITVYGYETLKLTERLRVTGGLSYEHLRYPRNFRSPPITDGEETRERLNPKAALVWEVNSATTLRGMYSKFLGGVTLDESFRLEPAQLAQFGQAYRTIIPESLVGSVAAPDYEVWGGAVDWKLPTRTYFSLQGESLRSEVHQTVGVFDFFQVPPSTSPRILPASVREHLNYQEQTFFVTVNQLIGNEWSLGAQYRFTRSELEATSPQFAGVPGGEGLVNRAELHRLTLYALYNHPSGCFAKVESDSYSQNNFADASSLPGDKFNQLNFYVGYRFPRQRGDLTLGLLNIMNENYHLNPVTPYLELPRERVFQARLRFRF